MTDIQSLASSLPTFHPIESIHKDTLFFEITKKTIFFIRFILFCSFGIDFFITFQLSFSTDFLL